MKYGQVIILSEHKEKRWRRSKNSGRSGRVGCRSAERWRFIGLKISLGDPTMMTERAAGVLGLVRFRRFCWRGSGMLDVMIIMQRVCAIAVPLEGGLLVNRP